MSSKTFSDGPGSDYESAEEIKDEDLDTSFEAGPVLRKRQLASDDEDLQEDDVDADDDKTVAVELNVDGNICGAVALVDEQSSTCLASNGVTNSSYVEDKIDCSEDADVAGFEEKDLGGSDGEDEEAIAATVQALTLSVDSVLIKDKIEDPATADEKPLDRDAGDVACGSAEGVVLVVPNESESSREEINPVNDLQAANEYSRISSNGREQHETPEETRSAVYTDGLSSSAEKFDTSRLISGDCESDVDGAYFGFTAGIRQYNREHLNSGGDTSDQDAEVLNCLIMNSPKKSVTPDPRVEDIFDPVCDHADELLMAVSNERPKSRSSEHSLGEFGSKQISSSPHPTDLPGLTGPENRDQPTSDPGDDKSDRGTNKEDSNEFMGEAGEGEEGEGENDDVDEDRKNPAFVPKRGVFYQHDLRVYDEGEKTEQAISKKTRYLEKASRWDHDMFDVQQQTPKSSRELADMYGYDIRGDGAPPRNDNSKKYARSGKKAAPDWRDPETYSRRGSRGRGGNVRGGSALGARRGNIGADSDEPGQVFEQDFPPLAVDLGSQDGDPKPPVVRRRSEASETEGQSRSSPPRVRGDTNRSTAKPQNDRNALSYRNQSGGRKLNAAEMDRESGPARSSAADSHSRNAPWVGDSKPSIDDNSEKSNWPSLVEKAGPLSNNMRQTGSSGSNKMPLTRREDNDDSNFRNRRGGFRGRMENNYDDRLNDKGNQRGGQNRLNGYERGAPPTARGRNSRGRYSESNTYRGGAGGFQRDGPRDFSYSNNSGGGSTRQDGFYSRNSSMGNSVGRGRERGGANRDYDYSAGSRSSGPPPYRGVDAQYASTVNRGYRGSAGDRGDLMMRGTARGFGRDRYHGESSFGRGESRSMYNSGHKEVYERFGGHNDDAPPIMRQRSWHESRRGLGQSTGWEGNGKGGYGDEPRDAWRTQDVGYQRNVKTFREGRRVSAEAEDAGFYAATSSRGQDYDYDQKMPSMEFRSRRSLLTESNAPHPHQPLIPPASSNLAQQPSSYTQRPSSIVYRDKPDRHDFGSSGRGDRKDNAPPNSSWGDGDRSVGGTRPRGGGRPPLSYSRQRGAVSVTSGKDYDSGFVTGGGDGHAVTNVNPASEPVHGNKYGGGGGNRAGIFASFNSRGRPPSQEEGDFIMSPLSDHGDIDGEQFVGVAMRSERPPRFRRDETDLTECFDSRNHSFRPEDASNLASQTSVGGQSAQQTRSYATFNNNNSRGNYRAVSSGSASGAEAGGAGMEFVGALPMDGPVGVGGGMLDTSLDSSNGSIDPNQDQFVTRSGPQNSHYQQQGLSHRGGSQATSSIRPGEHADGRAPVKRYSAMRQQQQVRMGLPPQQATQAAVPPQPQPPLTTGGAALAALGLSPAAMPASSLSLQTLPPPTMHLGTYYNAGYSSNGAGVMYPDSTGLEDPNQSFEMMYGDGAGYVAAGMSANSGFPHQEGSFPYVSLPPPPFQGSGGLPLGGGTMFNPSAASGGQGVGSHHPAAMYQNLHDMGDRYSVPPPVSSSGGTVYFDPETQQIYPRRSGPPQSRPKVALPIVPPTVGALSGSSSMTDSTQSSGRFSATEKQELEETKEERRIFDNMNSVSRRSPRPGGGRHHDPRSSPGMHQRSGARSPSPPPPEEPTHNVDSSRRFIDKDSVVR